MISKKYFGLVMHMWLSLFNATVVTSIMIFKNTGALPLVPVIISIFQAFVASFLAGLIVPAAPYGKKLALERFSCQEGTFQFAIISNIPVCLWMATVLSFLFAILNVGFSDVLLMVALSSIPLAFIISLVTTFLLTPVAMNLSNRITN